ncbi:hypothetical protein APUTEX25_000572, partial [Auxenochlorella protothecoides]
VRHAGRRRTARGWGGGGPHAGLGGLRRGGAAPGARLGAAGAGDPGLRLRPQARREAGEWQWDILGRGPVGDQPCGRVPGPRLALCRRGRRRDGGAGAGRRGGRRERPRWPPTAPAVRAVGGGGPRRAPRPRPRRPPRGGARDAQGLCPRVRRRLHRGAEPAGGARAVRLAVRGLLGGAPGPPDPGPRGRVVAPRRRPARRRLRGAQ